MSATRGLDQEQIDRAIGDSFTRLPPHLSYPEVWVDYEEDDQEDDLENLRPLPASVEVSVRSGKLQLTDRPGDASFTSSIDPQVVRDEILIDLRRLTPRLANSGELASALGRYGEVLSAENQNVIVVGLKGAHLERVFDAISKPDAASDGFALLPDVEGGLKGVLLQHFLYVSQFPAWRKFLEDAKDSPFNSDHIAEAKSTSSQISEVLEQEPDVCDPRVPAALRRAADEIDISDDSQNYAVHNTFVSEENAIKGPVIWAAKEIRRLGGEIGTAARKGFVEYIGKGMSRLLMRLLGNAAIDVLADSFPHWFAWLKHARDIFGSH